MCSDDYNVDLSLLWTPPILYHPLFMGLLLLFLFENHLKKGWLNSSIMNYINNLLYTDEDYTDKLLNYNIIK